MLVLLYICVCVFYFLITRCNSYNALNLHMNCFFFANLLYLEEYFVLLFLSVLFYCSLAGPTRILCCFFLSFPCTWSNQSAVFFSSIVGILGNIYSSFKQMLQIEVFTFLKSSGSRVETNAVSIAYSHLVNGIGAFFSGSIWLIEHACGFYQCHSASNCWKCCWACKCNHVRHEG